METTSKLKKPQDLEYINSSDMDELLWWSVQLSVCPEKLLGLISESGSSVTAIKRKIDAKSK